MNTSRAQRCELREHRAKRPATGHLPCVCPVPEDGVAVGHHFGAGLLAENTHPEQQTGEQHHLHLHSQHHYPWGLGRLFRRDRWRLSFTWARAVWSQTQPPTAGYKAEEWHAGLGDTCSRRPCAQLKQTVLVNTVSYSRQCVQPWRTELNSYLLVHRGKTDTNWNKQGSVTPGGARQMSMPSR